ncbi:MAG: glycosyltransferase family 4 protein [Acidimicrobiales bacterium]|nr:glycosyltransferase family 4 protein [Acidimicrobiales bacterium]
MTQSSGSAEMTLRVAFDVTSLLEARTGVGAMAAALLDGLARRPDLSLDAFAVSWRGRDRIGEVVPAGVAAHARPFPARLARAAWARSDVPTVRALAGRFDVVHGPNFVVPPGGGAAEVVTVHDLTAVRFPEMCTADVLQWPPLLRRAARRGAWVHAVSEHVGNEVRSAFPELGDRVVAVPNGVDPPPMPTPASDAAAGRALAGADRFVLALGTVDPRKDLPTLVAAFDQVAAHEPDLRLVIAGADGLAASELSAAIAASPHRDRVVRTGRIGTDERWALLRGASVVAYPSRYEGFGLVPLEAMSVGVPVVATAVGAIPEVVGEAALLVAERDAEALADAIHRVLTDEAVAASLVAAGSDRVARFSWDRSVEGVAALYRRAAAAR